MVELVFTEADFKLPLETPQCKLLALLTGNIKTNNSDATAGDLSTFVDIGGIFGAIFAGLLSDFSNSSAITCAIMLILSIPSVSTPVLSLCVLTLLVSAS